jgi:hypothetical protein
MSKRLSAKDIKKISALAQVKEPNQIAILEDRLQWLVEATFIKTAGFPGVVARDIEGANRVYELCAAIEQELEDPHLRAELRVAHMCGLPIDVIKALPFPPPVAKLQEAVTELKLRACVVHNNNNYTGNDLRRVREMFWKSVDGFIRLCGGCLKYSGSGDSNLPKVMELLEPHVPAAIRNVGARTVWNMINRGEKKRRKNPVI